MIPEKEEYQGMRLALTNESTATDPSGLLGQDTAQVQYCTICFALADPQLDSERGPAINSGP